MKKNLLLMMLCCPMVLAAQNGVTVSNLAVSNGTVTFNVSWNKDAMPVALWSDTVWVFVDYNNAGKTERLPLLPGATLTATSPGGKVIEEPGNNQGVWVAGNAQDVGAFSATVKLLTVPAEVAGACAYASNYPPVGEYTSATDISFTGTPEYEIALEEITSGNTSTTYSNGAFTIPAGHIIQSFTDATGAPGQLNCISPSAYTLSGSNICLGADAILTLSGSESGWRYQLYKDNIPVGSEKEGTGSALTFSEESTAAGRFSYTVQTVDATGAQCEIAVSNVLAITVNIVPIIYHSGGDASQTVNQNTAIAAMTYTASNAAIITMTGSFPKGVNGNVSGSSYTISGTPTVTGTFGYSLTAAVGSCSSTAAVGTITVNVPTPPHAASTQTWTFGALTWSDRIVATPVECKLTDDLSTTDYDALEYRVYYGRVYYSGNCVVAAQTTLCPEPWLVPTVNELSLARAAGWDRISADWGWGGLAEGGDVLGQGSSGRITSTSRNGRNVSYYYFRWELDGETKVTDAYAVFSTEVRCVKK
jgi:hypothetical protein